MSLIYNLCSTINKNYWVTKKEEIEERNPFSKACYWSVAEECPCPNKILQFSWTILIIAIFATNKNAASQPTNLVWDYTSLLIYTILPPCTKVNLFYVFWRLAALFSSSVISSFNTLKRVALTTVWSQSLKTFYNVDAL